MAKQAFRKATILAAVALLTLLPASAVHAQNGAVVLAPLSGGPALVGQSIAKAARSVFLDELPVLDDGCDAETAAQAAHDVVEAGDRLVIGLPCIDAFDAVAPILSAANIPILAVGIQAADVTRPPHSETDWPVFRIGPPQHEEWAVLARYIAANWRDESFAIIDDGTLYGRQLAENLRLLLAESALEPVFTDTYRPLLEDQMPLVRRLQRSGATHVILGGEARDAAVIGRNAEEIGYSLSIAGGGILRAPPVDGRLPDGTIMSAIPVETDFGMLAAQVAQQALSLQSNDLAADLRNNIYQTGLGPISFGEDGEPDREFFIVHELRGGQAIPLSELDG